MERRGCHFRTAKTRSVLRHSVVFLCFEITRKRWLCKLDWMPSAKLRSGKGVGGGVWSRAHSHSFFTRVAHHELLSSLFWTSFSYPVLHSCLNFGESHFAGVVKSRIPLKFPKSRTIQILHPRTTLPDPAKRFLLQRIFTTWYGLTLCVFISFAFEQTSYVIM